MCECGALWGWRVGYKLWEESKSLIRRNGAEVMVCLWAVNNQFVNSVSLRSGIGAGLGFECFVVGSRCQ